MDVFNAYNNKGCMDKWVSLFLKEDELKGFMVPIEKCITTLVLIVCVVCVFFNTDECMSTIKAADLSGTAR